MGVLRVLLVFVLVFSLFLARPGFLPVLIETFEIVFDELMLLILCIILFESVVVFVSDGGKDWWKFRSFRDKHEVIVGSKASIFECLFAVVSRPVFDFECDLDSCLSAPEISPLRRS